MRRSMMKSGRNVPEFEHVGADVEAGLRLLADQVAEELELAGLTVVKHGDAGAGAMIEVDTGADAAGGVWVTWHADSRLRLAAAAAVQQGCVADPMIQRSGTITQIMLDALRAILAARGFGVVQEPDDMRPLWDQVVSPASGTRN